MNNLYRKFVIEQVIDAPGNATHKEMFEAMKAWFDEKMGQDISYIAVGSRPTDLLSSTNRARVEVDGDVMVMVVIDRDDPRKEYERMGWGYGKHDKAYDLTHNREDHLVYLPSEDYWLSTVFEGGEKRSQIKICMKK